MRIARQFGPASRRRVEQRRPVQGGRPSPRTPAFSRCGSDDATPGGRPWRECEQSQPFSLVGGNPDVAQGVSSVRRSARSSDRLHHRRRRRVRVCPSFVSVEFAFRSMAVGTDRFIRTRLPFRSVPCLVAIAVIAPAKSVSRVVTTHGEELQPGRNFRGRAPSAPRSVPAGRLALPRRAGTRARDGTPNQGDPSTAVVGRTSTSQAEWCGGGRSARRPDAGNDRHAQATEARMLPIRPGMRGCDPALHCRTQSTGSETTSMDRGSGQHHRSPK